MEYGLTVSKVTAMDDETLDYSLEPVRDIFMIDVKSFYASCEAVARGYNPLEVMLVVMSTADNTGSGLVLASSPMAKKVLGISNVMRARDVPYHPELVIVPPRMRFYISENMKINTIFKRYVSDKELHVYSIDESLLDVTTSLNYYFPDTNLSRSEKRYRLAQKIQAQVLEETGMYVTVGIGDNPLLAKLALDNASKHTKDMIADWTYKDITNTVWKMIPELEDFWGIGSRMGRNLRQLGLNSIYEVAQSDPNVLYKKYGAIGLQLWFHTNGIDRSRLGEVYLPRDKSLGNSQILHRDYRTQRDIEVVIREMADQVAIRIRRRDLQTNLVSLSIGFAQSVEGARHGFSRQLSIDATDNTEELSRHLLTIFRKHWQGEPVRQVGVTYGKLSDKSGYQLDLFQPFEHQEKSRKIDKTLDSVRQKYGFTSIFKASSLLESGRAIPRASLVGGHAGGTDGMDEGSQNA
jgi:DNA polymerase V